MAIGAYFIMAISGYFNNHFLCLLLVIILMAINGYFIDGY
jgi:hypothetical protein